MIHNSLGAIFQKKDSECLWRPCAVLPALCFFPIYLLLMEDHRSQVKQKVFQKQRHQRHLYRLTTEKHKLKEECKSGPYLVK